MLVDHAYFVFKGICRRLDGDRLSVDEDLALIRKIYARQHIHESGLARTILTQKRHYHTAVQIKVNGIIGLDGSEAFAYPSEFHCMCGF